MSPTNSPLSRRDFLTRAAILGIGGPAFLAACSSSKKATPSTAASGPGSGETGTAAAVGTVHIASWPFYIENDQNPAKSPTIIGFEKATGNKVDYKIAIDDNTSFTAKFEGDLKKGSGIGFDIAIPTSWMVSRWIQKGWAEELPNDLIPNKKNLLNRLANPSWDPNRAHSLPYAEGQVGIAYYPDKVGFEITSMADFLKPELKGKTTILSEMRDGIGMFLLQMGLKPEEATVEQCLAAIAQVKNYRDAGQFRKITGNGYIEDLGSGDTIAAMAWSGDVAGLQQSNPDIVWVLPKEGAMSFVDTMVIPKGGNTELAAAWMNWIYDPAVSGPLFEAISYVSPVKGAVDNMTAAGQKNPMINPPANADIHAFRDLSEDEAKQIEAAFVAATQQ